MSRSGDGRIIENPCPECRGTGKTKGKKTISLKIPPGVETGSRLKLSGEGEIGAQGGPPGDLYVVITVKEHSIFKREGQDVICETPISFSQAALGCEIEVPTLDGAVKLDIPEGTQTGTTFRLRGRGFPKLRGYGRGDQHVKVKVVTPTHLSAEQKEILRQLSDNMGDDKKGFFGKIFKDR